MKNPKIIIKNIRRSYFNYQIEIPNEDGSVKVIEGMSYKNNPVEIPIFKKDETNTN